MVRNSPMITALIVAAGSGARFGSEKHKQYQLLTGKPVLCWSIDAFKSHPLISDVYIVIHPGHSDEFQRATKTHNLHAPIIGGNSRQASVRKGLEAIRASHPDFVLIHDAARPLITENLITDLCREVQTSGAAIPGLPVTDTIKREINGELKTENRQGLFTVQTPQAFRFELIDRLHQKYQHQSFTDDAALFEADGHPIICIPGQSDNIKITYPEDFAMAERYLLSPRKKGQKWAS